jgi:hypothetical protein
VTQPTTLYRFYDASGRLLYVGIAGNPGRRFAQHGRDKSWWSQVASSTGVERTVRRTRSLRSGWSGSPSKPWGKPVDRAVDTTLRHGPATQRTPPLTCGGSPVHESGPRPLDHPKTGPDLRMDQGAESRGPPRTPKSLGPRSTKPQVRAWWSVDRIPPLGGIGAVL